MDINLDTNDLKVDINKEVERLDRANKASQKVALVYASRIASDVRKVIIPSISQKYKASTHDSVNLKIIGKSFGKGTRNRKMIGFKLRHITDNWKRATLTSYPLNLYENDTKVYTKRNPYIRATYNTPITYKREGTHIIKRTSSQLPRIAKMSEKDFIKEITTALQEVNQ